MKIRTNYVSNSSSSSFIIIYNSLADFEKLKPFGKGYHRLLKDLKSASLDDLRDEVFSVLDDYLREAVEKRRRWLRPTADNEWLEDHYDRTVNWPAEELLSALGRANARKINDKFDRINAAYKAGVIPENLEDEVTSDLSSIVDDMIAEVQAKRHIAALEYADDVDGYMEHEFMPFAAMAPRTKFKIVRISKH